VWGAMCVGLQHSLELLTVLIREQKQGKQKLKNQPIKKFSKKVRIFYEMI
jgi:hypothetical protein